MPSIPVVVGHPVAGYQSQQHVSDVSDGRIRQQALEVVLGQGRQIGAVIVAIATKINSGKYRDRMG